VMGGYGGGGRLSLLKMDLIIGPFAFCVVQINLRLRIELIDKTRFFPRLAVSQQPELGH
jgi:hypothetical protein